MSALEVLFRAKQRRFSYPEILNSATTFFNDCTRNVNVIIPKCGRQPYLFKCVAYMNHAAAHSGVSARITCVEHDIKPEAHEFCKIHNVDYIHIPRSPDQIFNKSLCYNIGYLAQRRKSDWTVFHDLDVLVPSQFFSSLSRIVQTTRKNWIQPYAQQSVYYLNPIPTGRIFDSDPVLDLHSFIHPSLGRQGMRGAPGGSIVVRSSAFERIGGYDPEMFSGYSPEDSFFWSKLEAASGPVPPTNRCHYKYAEYEPRELVFHLHHEPSWHGSTNRTAETIDLLRHFWSLQPNQKLDFVNHCQKIWKESVV